MKKEESKNPRHQKIELRDLYKLTEKSLLKETNSDQPHYVEVIRAQEFCRKYSEQLQLETITVESDGVTIAEEPPFTIGKNGTKIYTAGSRWINEWRSKERITLEEHNKRLLQRLSEAEEREKELIKKIEKMKPWYPESKITGNTDTSTTDQTNS